LELLKTKAPGKLLVQSEPPYRKATVSTNGPDVQRYAFLVQPAEVARAGFNLRRGLEFIPAQRSRPRLTGHRPDGEAYDAVDVGDETVGYPGSAAACQVPRPLLCKLPFQRVFKPHPEMGHGFFGLGWGGGCLPSARVSTLRGGGHSGRNAA